MVERPQFVLDVVGISSRGREKEVELEGKVPTLMPDLIAENRARLKAITASGLVDVSVGTLEELSDGNLGRVAEVHDTDTLNEGPGFTEKRFIVVVNADA